MAAPDRVVLEDSRDAGGSTYRAVQRSEDGTITLLGQDLGSTAAGFFGGGEYEFARRLPAADTARLREVLGLADGEDLLTAIGERFSSSTSFEALLSEHDITGEFWSRSGD